MDLILDSANGKLVIIAINNGSEFVEILEDGGSIAEQITVVVEKVLAKSGINDILNVNNFGINVGPGSFTGIRIAISYLSGVLAFFPKNANIVEFTTLDILENQLDFKSDVVVMKADNFGNYFVKYKNSLEIQTLKYEEIEKNSGYLYAVDDHISSDIFSNFKKVSVSRNSVNGIKKSYLLGQKVAINENFVINPRYFNSFV